MSLAMHVITSLVDDPADDAIVDACLVAELSTASNHIDAEDVSEHDLSITDGDIPADVGPASGARPVNPHSHAVNGAWAEGGRGRGGTRLRTRLLRPRTVS